MINSGRFINDSMGGYVAKQVVKKLIASDISMKNSRVLVMGTTFKENVSDIRNSKVVDIVNELQSFGLSVDVMDPYADSEEVKNEYGFELKDKNGMNYHAVVVAVNHNEYMSLDEEYFKSILIDKGVLVDIKGIYRGKIKHLNYWSL